MGLAASLLCVFVAVLFTKIRALDLGASINPFSGNKQFVTRIVERLPSLEEGANERLATYRDAEGQDFSCLMPASVTEGDVHVDQQALLQSAEDLLGKIGGDCVRQKEGWWVFEVCVGFQVRQYHTTNGVLDEEFIMGVFNATEQDYTLKGRQGASLHAVQVYTRGQVCDLTGMERRVDVRFLCSDDPIHIRAIEEIMSCQYVIVIGTPAMCSEALGTVPGGREKVQLKEAYCKAHETSRDTQAVVQQAIANSVEKSRSRGEAHLPDSVSTHEPGAHSSNTDALEAQDNEAEHGSTGDQQNSRQEL